MVYVDLGGSQLWVTSSQNGSDWGKPQNFPSIRPFLPVIMVFLDQLWVIFSDSQSSQLSVAHSNNGQTFSSP